MKLLTIFTPTYNRAYILPNLYNSLKAQTNKDFVWMIIDDGSTDGTEELVKSFQSEGLVDICYYYQENSGKHIAHNVAVSLCVTKLFFCVDSDDRIINNCVELICKDYDLHEKENILGIYYRKGTTCEIPNGGKLPFDLYYVKIRDLYDLYGFRGEMAIVLYTEKISNFKFPAFNNERFMTESIFYYQLNDIAPMLLIDKVIYLFDYLGDGLTKNSNLLSYANPYGTALSFIITSKYCKNSYTKLKKLAQYQAWKFVFNLKSNEFELYKSEDVNFLSIVPFFIYYVLFFSLNRLKINMNRVY